MMVGQRRIQLFRAYNQREGFHAKDDVLPEKLYQPLADVGPSGGYTINRDDFQKSKKYYYGLAGWDQETGMVSQSKLMEMGLDWIVPEALLQ